jgi:geranylgeranyl reductase family protein
VYDAIVIGGGPAGSTLAARLGQAGRKVVLLEKERFPRFHIGESLLPCSMPMFDQIGVLPALRRAGFLQKHAAEFVTGDGSMKRRYPFADGIVPGPASAFEVDRATFDRVLLDNARERGAEVREGVEVRSFESQRRGVEVVARGDSGRDQHLSARVLVDASGQRSLVASRHGLREMDPELKNFAVFSHYAGAERASGDREGDITVVIVEHGWWWVIPLSGNRTSVGLVAPRRALGGSRPDEQFFEQRIASTPYLARRFAPATRVEKVRTISDYSYLSRRFAGDGWVLIGDAAAFIDPVFSTGVYLGMAAGFRAADAIDQSLGSGRVPRRAFAGYERWMRRAIDVYKRFVKGFYTPGFAEVLMHPSDRFQLRQAVTSLLAGYVMHPDVAWRIRVFEAIALANRRLRLTPRLPGREQEKAAEALGSL